MSELPHSIEAENAVLGCILTNNDGFDRVSDILSTTHFFLRANQKIFDTCVTMIRAGKTASEATIKSFLPPDVGEAGMKRDDYLIHLVRRSTTIINVAEYAKIVRDHAARRELIAIADEMTADASELRPDYFAEQQIEEIERKLARIKNDLGKGPSSTPLQITFVANVEPKAIEWIWPDRIARGHLALISGPPGSAKSQISADVAARITTGGKWPDGDSAPSGSVVMLSAEDSIADVMRPRLEAAGADLTRIAVIEAVKGADGLERIFDLQHDLHELRKLVVSSKGDVSLVIIDPITSYMGVKIDSHRTTDVRSVLHPLARFAEETGVAVLAISHPPKSTQGGAINSVTGSLAFVAAPRTVFITTEEPDTQRRLLLPVKNNLGPKAAGIGYRMTQRTVSKGIVGSHIVWDTAPVTMTADEAVNQQSSSDNGKIAHAKEFLRDELASGPVLAETIKAAAAREDIRDRTLRRARTELKVKIEKCGYGGKSIWSLHDNGGQDGHVH